MGNLIPIQLSTSLSVSLRSVSKTCLIKRKYPSQWKESVITPVYKNENETAIHNYRPINSPSSPPKVFEKVIFDGLFNCINDQIHGSKNCLRPRRSTNVQLLCFTHKIYVFKDRKTTEELVVFYLVFQKSSTKYATINFRTNFLPWD